MPFLRRIAWAGFLWLTAISTVIAGMPHFVCHCPDGKSHDVLLFSTCKMAGCGCAASMERGSETSTCPSAQVQLKKKSCCSRHEEPPTKTETGGESAKSQTCQKTVEQADAQASPVAAPTDGIGFVTLERDEASIFSFLFSAESREPRWEPYRIPPPLDLITVLQRLTI